MTALSQHLLQWQGFFQANVVVGVLIYAGLVVLLQLFCAPLSPVAVAGGLIFGLRGGFIAIQLGTSAGAALNFLLARYLARERVARWLGGNAKFRQIDAAVGREGWKIVALLRLCPIPFGLANYSYALTAVRFWPYLIATVIAILPANFFFSWCGATSSNALATASGNTGASRGQMVFTVIGLLAFFVALTYVTKVAKRAVNQPLGESPCEP